MSAQAELETDKMGRKVTFKLEDWSRGSTAKCRCWDTGIPSERTFLNFEKTFSIEAQSNRAKKTKLRFLQEGETYLELLEQMTKLEAKVSSA